MSFKWIVKYWRFIPYIFELVAGVIALLAKLPIKFAYKTILFVILMILGAFLIGCIVEPYAIEPDHPFDTLERMYDMFIDNFK